MNWLIMVADGADVNEVKQLLIGWGCELKGDIALDGLKILEAEGPPDLPEQASHDERIVEVHPNSTMSYF